VRKPTFAELFCGGGMARAGLGPEWRCILANDIDSAKGDSYIRNFGDAEFRLGDVADLLAGDVPQADLIWMSPPCQDLSVAGERAGLKGARSGAFWPAALLLEELKAWGKAPTLIAIENVVGLLTSHSGADFRAVGAALGDLGYVFGALVIDAAHFLPQSRPRVFVIAIRRGAIIPSSLVSASPPKHYVTTELLRAASSMPSWVWWRLPEAPKRNASLIDLLEPDGAVRWHSDAQTAAIVSGLSPSSRAQVSAAKGRSVGALFRRTRANGPQWEARFDGLAGCLRTSGGARRAKR
jgi:DNA (cytosine-5)-methyltransferase 1